MDVEASSRKMEFPGAAEPCQATQDQGSHAYTTSQPVLPPSLLGELPPAGLAPSKPSQQLLSPVAHSSHCPASTGQAPCKQLERPGHRHSRTGDWGLGTGRDPLHLALALLGKESRAPHLASISYQVTEKSGQHGQCRTGTQQVPRRPRGTGGCRGVHSTTRPEVRVLELTGP